MHPPEANGPARKACQGEPKCDVQFFHSQKEYVEKEFGASEPGFTQFECSRRLIRHALRVAKVSCFLKAIVVGIQTWVTGPLHPGIELGTQLFLCR